MLQIRLLGQFDIRIDGKRASISTRSGQSLLAYLALTAGTAHRREKTAGMFWPDTSDESARKNLRQELWRIRKALSVQKADTEDYFIANDLTIAFNRDSEYWLDVAQVERPDLDLEALTTNLALYQGELLPGFYDEWIIIERERIQSIFDNKMGQLLEQLITSERWTAVQEQSERWLSMGNSVEPAYRGLMLSYGARGDMAKVSTIYQRCIADLDEKFGLEPSPETRALYDGLLKGSHKISHSTQPSGTVTFLFTDIAGSTKLLDQLKDQYATVLADHHKIMRAAIKKWNGREVDTQGDAFFVTFSRALDAVQCAAEAQRELTSHKWLHKSPLRVRMGLHTGEPFLASTGYVGMDVHRAARIGDAGHGGQVLISQTTRELVILDLPEDLSIRDLGEHRLKDLRYPTPIHQLVIEGLPSEFPPLRTKFSGTEAPAPGEPPFKGLQYFDEADSNLFYGREVLTAKLVNRLRETKFLSVVIGASGSGKSSLVRAGVIPALKNEKELINGIKPPEGSSDWEVHIITPTTHPIEALAVELTRDSESLTATATLMDDLMQDPRSLALHFARKNSKQHTLLVLDQFEELFTLCRDEFEREAFIDNLLTALVTPTDEDRQRGGGKITLILTLRADFYAHLAQYTELRDAVASQQEYIGPMTMEELRRAIEEPAKRAHWAFEPGLVDLILRDVGDEPGALPLLSHALLETWKRRAGHTMTLKGYADAGGVRGAIAHTAESVFENLSDDEQTIARNIFVRLTELGEGTEDTRRRVLFDELLSSEENADEVRAVLNMLADARLVTLGEETAEVAHEALIREWPALREWLNQDREGLQLHRRLTESAHEWELLEHDIGSLYQGARLAQANEWSAHHNPDALNAQERLFLDASNRQVEQEERAREEQRAREATLKQRVQRVLQVLVGVLLIAAIVSGGLAFWANGQRKEALRQASIGLAALAENELEGVDREVGVLLALEAVEHYPFTPQAMGALAHSVEEFRSYRILSGGESMTEIVQVGTWSPDGKHIAGGGSATPNSLVIWDAATGDELLATKTHAGLCQETVNQMLDLAWSPDGGRLAAIARDTESGATCGTVILDATSGKRLLVIAQNESVGRSLDWSPDGTTLLIGHEDGTARLWDAVSGMEIMRLTGHSGVVYDAIFSPDGRRIATASEDGTIRLWDTRTGAEQRRLDGHAGAVRSIAWSPDGTRFVSGGDDGLPRVWDVANGEVLFVLPGHVDNVVIVTWSEDGRRLATQSLDAIIKVWDAATGGFLFQIPNATPNANTKRGYVEFSPDGNSILAGGSRVLGMHIWDASIFVPKLFGHTFGQEWGGWSPDGTLIATSGTDGSARLWDAVTGQQLKAFEGSFWGDWSPDGDYLAFADGISAYNINIWEVATGEMVLRLSVPEDTYGSPQFLTMAWSPDGAMIAGAAFRPGTPQAVYVWDVATSEIIATLQTDDLCMQGWPRWSPDGTQLATGCIFVEAGTNTPARIWDIASETEVMRLESEYGWTYRTVWSPDGTRLFTSYEHGVMKIWDAATWEHILTFTGHQGVSAGKWSPDGALIASVDYTEQIIKIWNSETGEELFSFSVDGAPLTINWSPDGTHVIITADGLKEPVIKRVWRSTDELVEYAYNCCVSRELTPEERLQYGLPEKP